MDVAFFGAGLQVDTEDGYLLPDDHEEEEVIAYYFYRGFQYEEIVMFLEKHHGITMSMRTLKRRLKSYGLQRRKPEYDIDLVRTAVQGIIDGPGCLQGYRLVWHTLQLKGIRVPRIVVEELIRELDPEGTELRKAHRYQNPGPNYAWHCDGYDKLKPYGFPINGCIDGWSRKILCLYVTRSNNQPDNIAAYYLDAVHQVWRVPS